MSITAMKQALEALEQLDGIDTETECVTIDVGNEIEALRQAIAEAEKQEPFGYFRPEPFGWTDCAETDEGATPLYTSPPQRQPLTDEQIEQLEQDTCAMDFPETVRAIEAAHGIKGDA